MLQPASSQASAHFCATGHEDNGKIVNAPMSHLMIKAMINSDETIDGLSNADAR
jgi:hypothetical protein